MTPGIKDFAFDCAAIKGLAVAAADVQRRVRCGSTCYLFAQDVYQILFLHG
jgi:hypothetical protein